MILKSPYNVLCSKCPGPSYHLLDYLFASILPSSVLATRFQGALPPNILLFLSPWAPRFWHLPDTLVHCRGTPLPPASILRRLALGTPQQATSTFVTNIFLYNCACSLLALQSRQVQLLLFTVCICNNFSFTFCML